MRPWPLGERTNSTYRPTILELDESTLQRTMQVVYSEFVMSYHKSHVFSEEKG